MQAFKNLNQKEHEFLIHLPVLITFLVAGADNHIDYNEKQWAEKLLKFRADNNGNEILSKYYAEVEKHWTNVFNYYAGILIDQKDAGPRSEYLVDLISKVNPMLEKLHAHTSKILTDSWRSFAGQVAKASGGIWGWGATSPEEFKWVGLPMIKVPDHTEHKIKIHEI
jgi:hypothetical protein